jgi:uncharacterized membrane protein
MSEDSTRQRDDGPTEGLPEHIEHTVQAIAILHEAHEKRATPLQRLVDEMTATVARPAFVGAVTVVVVAWIAGNLLLQRLLGWRIDPPDFPLLHIAGELSAIYITALILISQRRREELSELREQLNLELAIMTELKVAKLIALNEEMRRDNPQLHDRVDPQAEAMAMPADPTAVLDAFIETRGGPPLQPTQDQTSKVDPSEPKDTASRD